MRLSDAIEFRGATSEALQFTKPSFSGNLLAEVEATGPLAVVSCRGSAFEAPPAGSAPAPIEKAALPERLVHAGKRFVELNKTPLARPELTEADQTLIDAAHRRIFDAIVAGNADAARTAMATHIDDVQARLERAAVTF